jgi:hypothetical protein
MAVRRHGRGRHTIGRRERARRVEEDPESIRHRSIVRQVVAVVAGGREAVGLDIARRRVAADRVAAEADLVTAGREVEAGQVAARKPRTD